jgi:glycine hydroxymethyltransferase
MILCKAEHQKIIDSRVFPGTQGGPLMHVIAGKAVCFLEALQPEFKTYQTQVIANAKALAQGLIEQGFDLVSGGTDNHLILLDLRSKNITGKDAETALNSAHLVVNKNKIPFDPAPAQITSGIRLGTPAVTTRGLKVPAMQQISNWMSQVLAAPEDGQLREKIRAQILELTSRL